MISINCDNITLSFGVDVILDRISFSLNDGEKLGIVGVNGAGKSSLVKVITGEYQPDSGNVYIAKGKTVGVLDQYVNFEAESTVFEEMLSTYSELLEAEKQLEILRNSVENGDSSLAARYAELHDKFTREGGFEYKGRCRGILKNLGFGDEFLNLKISSLSGGQKTRLALARLLVQAPDILILDEPTNHLDMSAIDWLEDFMAEYQKNVIVISHDRYFLDKVVGKILDIENKRGRVYNGNYTAFVAQKKTDREIQEKHYKNQQKEIARIEAYIEQQRRWNRERNIIAAESRQKQLDKMVRVDAPDAPHAKIRLTFNKSNESGNDVLILNKLSKSFGDNNLFLDTDYLVKKNERVFIVGHNGCGKSTLIKIIAGKLAADRGEVIYGSNVKIGYYDQENQQLDENNTVLDELWNQYEERTQTEIRNALALFLFTGDDISKKISVLSGGEKARLTLCKLVLSKMNLLILDEPTNHLDINSREVLEDALLKFEGTIIAVSHDKYFINKLATRIMYFDDTAPQIYDFKGGFEEYTRERKSGVKGGVASDKKEQSDSLSKQDYLKNKEAAADKRKLERKIKLSKEECEKIEARLAEIDEQSQGEAATDAALLTELFCEKEELELRLLELYEFLDSQSEI